MFKVSMKSGIAAGDVCPPEEEDASQEAVKKGFSQFFFQLPADEYSSVKALPIFIERNNAVVVHSNPHSDLKLQSGSKDNIAGVFLDTNSPSLKDEPDLGTSSSHESPLINQANKGKGYCKIFFRLPDKEHEVVRTTPVILRKDFGKLTTELITINASKKESETSKDTEWGKDSKFPVFFRKEKKSNSFSRFPIEENCSDPDLISYQMTDFNSSSEFRCNVSSCISKEAAFLSIPDNLKAFYLPPIIAKKSDVSLCKWGYKSEKYDSDWGDHSREIDCRNLVSDEKNKKGCKKTRKNKNKETEIIDLDSENDSVIMEPLKPTLRKKRIRERMRNQESQIIDLDGENDRIRSEIICLDSEASDSDDLYEVKPKETSQVIRWIVEEDGLTKEKNCFVKEPSDEENIPTSSASKESKEIDLSSLKKESSPVEEVDIENVDTPTEEEIIPSEIPSSLDHEAPKKELELKKRKGHVIPKNSHHCDLIESYSKKKKIKKKVKNVKIADIF